HQPGRDLWWQESVFVSWWDERARLGGVFRLGHEPNQGLANVWLGLVSEDGRRFRFCNSTIPLTDSDRADGNLSAHHGPRRLCGTVPRDGRLACAFGPDLAFAIVTWHSTDNDLFTGGFVFRDGTIIRAEAVDPLPYLEADGITIRGGEAHWYLDDDTSLSLRCAPVDGLLFSH